MLRSWCRTGYGKHWLTVARERGGLMRVKPGQMIPVVHMVALGDEPIFIVPQQRVQVGHRGVGSCDFRSGRPLEEGELAITPEIRLEIVEDPALIEGGRLEALGRDSTITLLNVKTPSAIFSSPAQHLIAPSSWPKKAFVLYQHIFGHSGSYPGDGYFYVGVTTRSWQLRWAEHRRAIEAGSPLLFHRKLRDELAAGRVTYIHHKVMGITDDLEALYSAEEAIVEGHWIDARRLNMIPGGKSGLRYLRENGMLADRVVPMPDERDRILEAWLRDHPRKGLPAPWVSEKWKDDAWAVAQICGRDDRLSVDQVRAIRELANSFPVQEIVVRIGARNTDQVQRVLDGKTYNRVV
ncbi:hypothetical protein [Hyphomicrobium sp. 99]|uniref:hypothetical protein n=1 Tax=Hyphomicrobium sp. 99 TaxID=1163419 RepID=UPI0018CCF12D|nr:hypothetical protein [Hyphomicrobium sp. 99]